MGVQKKRLDILLVERGLCESRQQARGMILAGQVIVEEQRVDKAGAQIREDANLRLKQPRSPYVSRGGLKLEAALKHFGLDPEGCLALDLGASTGGFTDCLLQRGSRGVTAVDVGYGQFHHRLRSDPKVCCLERTNARYLTREQLPLSEGEQYDLIVADLSFISLRLVLEAVVPFLRIGGDMILLIKPQFEAGRDAISKGGVVRDHEVRQRCADQVLEVARTLGMDKKEQMDSPVHGPKGNIEILMWLQKGERGFGDQPSELEHP